jgi:hypothetical protein
MLILQLKMLQDHLQALRQEMALLLAKVMSG